MLTQVADGVWVRQSEWVFTNSIVVRGEDGLILVDPGIEGSELSQLADALNGYRTDRGRGARSVRHMARV